MNLINDFNLKFNYFAKHDKYNKTDISSYLRLFFFENDV
jgi:hypothetical protein